MGGSNHRGGLPLAMREGLPGSPENSYFSFRSKDLKQGQARQKHSLVEQEQALDGASRQSRDRVACVAPVCTGAVAGRSRKRRGRGRGAGAPAA